MKWHISEILLTLVLGFSSVLSSKKTTLVQQLATTYDAVRSSGAIVKAALPSCRVPVILYVSLCHNRIRHPVVNNGIHRHSHRVSRQYLKSKGVRRQSGGGERRGMSKGNEAQEEEEEVRKEEEEEKRRNTRWRKKRKRDKRGRSKESNKWK